MLKEHLYQIFLQWTGSNGRGTANYRAYDHSYEIEVPGKPIIFGSSDPAFRGDQTKYNPEELFIASLSSCHMLWYLHLCAEAGIIVNLLKKAWGDSPRKVRSRYRSCISEFAQADRCFLSNELP